MLHHLDGDDAIERFIGKPLQVGHGIVAVRRQTALAAFLHHAFVRVDSTRADAGAAEQIQQFAAATSDVEDMRRAAKIGR